MRTRSPARLAGPLLAAALALTACTSVPGATPPAPSPTPGHTPTPVPTPKAPLSPPAAEGLHRAARLEENGEYEQAAAELRALLEVGAAAEVEREALLRLGRCELESAAYERAVESLSRYLERYPDDAEAPSALFWLAEAHMGLGDGLAAAAAYRGYLEQRPLLAGYTEARIGDALATAGDQAGALAAYQAAADAETDAARRSGLLERQAGALRALGRHDEAVAAYDRVLELSADAGQRARAMFEAGAALEEAGRRAEAAARWNELVATYPLTVYAAQALPVLDRWQLAAAGALDRARVEYGAGRYASALEVLRRYILGDPAHSGTAHYWTALCYRQLGQHWDSVRELDWLIETHPLNELVPEAWYERGRSLLLAGDVDSAVSSFQALAERYPQAPRAVQALWQSAQTYENAGRRPEAAVAYARLAAAYPGASDAADARFRAGLAHFVDGRVAEAAETWADYLPQEGDPAMCARLLLWLGKAAERLGDTAAARERWEQAAATTPEGFWGLRARDLLAGRRFDGRAPAGAFDPDRYSMQSSAAEAERWLAGWAPPLPAGQVAGELPESLAGLDAFRRGMELWALGDAAAAQAELRQARAAVEDDAWALYALALHCHERGLYQHSILAALRLLALAPEDARAEAPRLIEVLAYPTYYADLVLPEAEAGDADPLLAFALMHQESLFDRHATSYADARGLTQVIPSTGEYIAGRLGDTAYTHESLWRPAVSVRYGLWYLSAALDMFDGDALMALVAYNAGPGNASRWGELAGGDPDLFFECVDNWQPRAYMQRIYEHRAHYGRLYP